MFSFFDYCAKLIVVIDMPKPLRASGARLNDGGAG